MIAYRPSGRVSLRHALRAVLFALGWAVVLGAVYAAMTSPRWHPAFQLIGALLGGVAAAGAASMLCKSAHSRSATFNRMLALGFVMVMALVRWTFVVASSVGWEQTGALWSQSPWAWLALSKALAQHWGQAPGAAAGPVGLGLTWAAELAVWGALAVGISALAAKEPYSEAAGAWAEDAFKGELLYPGMDPDTFRRRWTAEGVDVLGQGLIARAHQMPASAQWWTLELKGMAVQADPQARWLTISILIMEREDSGKIKRTTQPLVSGPVGVDEAVFNALRSRMLEPAWQDSHAPQAPEPAPDGATATPARADPFELEPAISALKADDFSLAYAMAKAHRQHPDVAVRQDAHRLCALALSRLARWQEAFDEWHLLHELEPTAFNALQLATTSVMAGELLRGQAWFERADALNREKREMSPAVLRTQMLCALESAGELAACTPHIHWLADMYGSLRTTDSHFLWMYDLPFFTTFLDKALPILSAVHGVDELRQWCLNLRDRVDDEGREHIDARLSKLQAPKLEGGAV